MALYFIGDLQGCHEPLQRLLQTCDFSPSRDTLYVLGDLVNRGPDSLAVLRQLNDLGDAAQCLLGNHDLSLLVLAAGLRRAHRSDTLQAVLNAPDREPLLDWLRHRPLALQAQGWLLVHAGVLPQWTAAQTLVLAGEVQTALRSADYLDFLAHMYGNEPAQWNKDLQGPDRLRVIVNALTRLRFCTPEGTMEFSANGPPDTAPAGYLPWYEAPGRQTLDTPIAFGHWSSLGVTPVRRHNTVCLDTGCLWGRLLTAARPEASGELTFFSVGCEATESNTTQRGN